MVILVVLVIAAVVVTVFTGNKKPLLPPEAINAGAKAASQVSIIKQDIKESNFSGSVSVISGSSTAAAEAEKFMEKEVADFRDRANKEVPAMRAEFGADAPPAKYSINLDAKYVTSPTTESVIVSEYVYTGGANGMSTYKVFTGSLSTGKILSLGEMVKPSEQSAFSMLVKQKLLAWVPEGLDQQLVFPEEVNKLSFADFSDWSMDNEGLTIYFDKYAIGPGVMGALAFTLPYFELQNYLSVPVSISSDSIFGCYVNRIGKDMYSLRLDSEENGQLAGSLSYQNYQKDSSSGTFAGEYDNGILLGDYVFSSEGMQSIRQVVFKKEGSSFVEGFGPTETKDGKEMLKDPKSATFDSKSAFVKEACGN